MSSNDKHGRESRHRDDCPDGLTWSIYVDDELSPEERREVDLHLMTCRSCREHVLAARDEGAALRTALREQELTRFVRPASEKARGLALGLAPALAITALVTTAAGWILESRLPFGLAWLNPFRLTGAIDMAFDTIFMLRDEAPALYQLALSTAGIVSVAVVLTFAFGAITRRYADPGTLALGIGLSLLLGAAAAPPAAAFVMHVDDDDRRLVVERDEILDHGLLMSGESLMIDGIVQGDVLALAERVIVRGRIEGDLFAVTRQVEIESGAVITGSLHALAANVLIGGTIEGSCYSAAAHHKLEVEGKIGRDTIHLGESITLAGEVGRDAVAMGETVDIRGSIGRDLQTRGDRVTLYSGSSIGGNVRAAISDEDEGLEVSDGARIGGEIERAPIEIERSSRFSRFAEGHFYLWIVLRLAAAFLVGMVTYRFLPWIYTGRIETGTEFFSNLLAGGIAMIAGPLALIILGLTVVGLPLAIIGLLLFGIMVYLSNIIVASLIGTALMGEPVPEEGYLRAGLPLLAGLAITICVSHLPLIGGLAHVIILMTGLGLLVDRARVRWFT